MIKGVRTRSYYRALKRGEAWAVKIAAKLISDPIAGLIMLMYRNVDMTALVYSSNPLLALITKDGAEWTGAYLPTPVFKPWSGTRKRSYHRAQK